MVICKQEQRRGKTNRSAGSDAKYSNHGKKEADTAHRLTAAGAGAGDCSAACGRQLHGFHQQHGHLLGAQCGEGIC